VIQLLLNKLMTKADLEQQEILTIIMAIRKKLSCTEDPPVTEILNGNILQMINQIYSFPDNSEEVKCMKVNSSIKLILIIARGNMDLD